MKMADFKQRLSSARAKTKKAPLGSGGRFAALKKTLSNRPGVKDPAALAAAIGRKKLGKERFQKLAAAGRRRAA